MKYDIILQDDEIEEILNLNLSFGERMKWFQDRYNIEQFKNNRKAKFVFSLVQGDRISGKIQNNPKDLKCPNCNGKYVVRTYVGDLYYRLIAGSKEQKKAEKEKFKKMGLHSNPWATGGEFTRDYMCLNCGIRWNGINEKIYSDE